MGRRHIELEGEQEVLVDRLKWRFGQTANGFDVHNDYSLLEGEVKECGVGRSIYWGMRGGTHADARMNHSGVSPNRIQVWLHWCSFSKR